MMTFVLNVFTVRVIDTRLGFFFYSDLGSGRMVGGRRVVG